ncbi:MAG: hypothetical protein V8Q46_00685 [Bifidobacterium angulatum]
MAQLEEIARSDAAGTTNFMHFLTKNSEGKYSVTHIGTMNQSMYQFASNRDINRTLSDLIIAQARHSTGVSAAGMRCIC